LIGGALFVFSEKTCIYAGVEVRLIII